MKIRRVAEMVAQIESKGNISDKSGREILFEVFKRINSTGEDRREQKQQDDYYQVEDEISEVIDILRDRLSKSDEDLSFLSIRGAKREKQVIKALKRVRFDVWYERTIPNRPKKSNILAGNPLDPIEVPMWKRSDGSYFKFLVSGFQEGYFTDEQHRSFVEELENVADGSGRRKYSMEYVSRSHAETARDHEMNYEEFSQVSRLNYDKGVFQRIYGLNERNKNVTATHIPDYFKMIPYYLDNKKRNPEILKFANTIVGSFIMRLFFRNQPSSGQFKDRGSASFDPSYDERLAQRPRSWAFRRIRYYMAYVFDRRFYNAYYENFHVNKFIRQGEDISYGLFHPAWYEVSRNLTLHRDEVNGLWSEDGRVLRVGRKMRLLELHQLMKAAFSDPEDFNKDGEFDKSLAELIALEAETGGDNLRRQERERRKRFLRKKLAYSKANIKDWDGKSSNKDITYVDAGENPARVETINLVDEIENMKAEINLHERRLNLLGYQPGVLFGSHSSGHVLKIQPTLRRHSQTPPSDPGFKIGG